MQFSPKTYSTLKLRLRQVYQRKLSSVLKQIKNGPPTKTSYWLVFHKDDFLEYSPLKWYFLKQVEALLFFLNHPIDSDPGDTFSPLEDAIFEKWNHSEF